MRVVDGWTNGRREVPLRLTITRFHPDCVADWKYGLASVVIGSKLVSELGTTATSSNAFIAT